MTLPTSYLTSYKNLPAILDAIKKAQAPDRFTIKFLQDLGFTSVADRLVIKMLKNLKLLTDAGEPTKAYHEFLDPSQSGRVLADGLGEAYADLFQINKDAHKMSTPEIRAKMKTISQGAHNDDVLGKMANTFTAFAALANFDAATEKQPAASAKQVAEVDGGMSAPDQDEHATRTLSAKMIYDIHIHLPATRDSAVYDALFTSLTKHLGSQ